MSTYAQQVDVDNYMTTSVSSDPLIVQKTILRAEREIDPIIYPVSPYLPPTQIIMMSGATGGTFGLNWHGTNPQETPQEAFNVSAAQLQTGLSALTNIGLGNVYVLGTYPVWTVVWDKAWAQSYFTDFEVPILVPDLTDITPPTATVTVILERGRKVDVIHDLNENQLLALSNATCAQVEYRTQMGDRFFVRGQYPKVQGPDFTTTGTLPRVGPRVRAELSQTGLLYRGARAKAGYIRRGVAKGWPSY